MLRTVRPALLAVTLALAAWSGAGVAAPGVSAGGACRGVTSTEGSGDSVSMTDSLCFTPTVLHVEPGTRVTWVNDGREPHSVAGATIAWGNYEEYRQRESVSHTFTDPGTYPYYCFVHNGMIGAIVVGDGKSVSDNSTVSRSAVDLTSARVAEPSGENLGQPFAGSRSEGDSSAQRLAYSGLGAVAGAMAFAAALGVRQARRR